MSGQTVIIVSRPARGGARRTPALQVTHGNVVVLPRGLGAPRGRLARLLRREATWVMRFLDRLGAISVIGGIPTLPIGF